MPTVLITGANRGLGLEFARQYADDGWRVIAGCRDPAAAAELQAIAGQHPGRVTVARLDVLDHAGIDALAATYKATPIDVLLNNAGIIGPRQAELHRQYFGTMDYAAMETVWRTNTVAPLKMSEVFAEHVAASAQKRSSSSPRVSVRLPNASSLSCPMPRRRRR